MNRCSDNQFWFKAIGFFAQAVCPIVLLKLPYLRENKQCLFKTDEVFGRAYFRDMIIQNIHRFLGTIFQNISYILADFNAFKYFYVSIITFEYTVML